MIRSFSCILLMLSVSFLACKKSSNETDTATTSKAEEAATCQGKKYSVNTAESEVSWRATHKGGLAPRWGTLKLNNGFFYVQDEQITSGQFLIDFTQIKVDPASVTENDKKSTDLEAHLKSADFFNVEKFPSASFDITSVVDFDPSKDKSVLEGANKIISGNLNLIGNPINITFPAKVTYLDGMVEVEAKFSLDRTSWGIKYGSLEDNPALWAISKDVDLGFKVVANAQ